MISQSHLQLSMLVTLMSSLSSSILLFQFALFSIGLTYVRIPLQHRLIFGMMMMMLVSSYWLTVCH